MSEKKKNPDLRYIAKVKTVETKYGAMYKVDVENPYPTNKDGQPNQYYKGNLIWVDAQTGKQYVVKQATLKGVSDTAREKGYTNSICIDLGSDYDVIKPQS